MQKYFDTFLVRLKELQGDESVSAFARRLAMPQNTLDCYMRGTRKPSVELLTRVCDTCGVSADWLLGIGDNPIGVSDTDWRSRALHAEQKLARVSKALGHALKGFEELQEAVR